MSQPPLLQPLSIRDVTLESRIVISPMATYSAVDGHANDWHLAHYGRLAFGQAASVMVEATAVTAQGRITNGDMGIWSKSHIAPLKRIADVMKAVGVVPSIQLAHAGRKGAMQRPWHGNAAITPADRARGDKTWDIVGPTAEPIDTGFIPPQALTSADMMRLATQWGEAAQRAIEAGFEIVEIHNAHGYLVHQFLSPISNTRQDAFGGDFEGRTRFPLMIAEAVRAAVPQGTPVFVRVSAVDGIDGGWSMDDTIAYAKALKLRGVDLVDCSSGGLKGPATAARIKRSWGFQVPFAARVRREADLMSMAVGLILDPLHANHIVGQGDADLVAIGREALVNPSWPQMAEIALGRPAIEAMDAWPVQYGWWLKNRETALAQVRRDGGDDWRI